jgi:hypothetical protein
MKEIKSYIRKSPVKAVVNALQQARAPGVTVVEVHPVGYGYQPNYFEPGFEEDVLKRYKYLESSSWRWFARTRTWRGYFRSYSMSATPANAVTG